MSDLNPLFDPATDNQVIPADQQARINQPLSGGALTAEDQIFLNQLVNLVEEGKIKLYDPSSLLNVDIYSKLDATTQAKVDQGAFLMLSKVRTIHDWSKMGLEMNYQMENMIHALRLDKERLEAEKDVFII